MLINTFWKIIIKSIGLWLLINCVWVIPQFMSTLNIIDGQVAWSNLVIVWLMCLTALIIYILVTRLFLFKTDWFVRILKLNESFAEDRINLDIPARTILTITVTVIGAVWFLRAFPNLITSIFEFMRQKELFKNYSETGWLIYYGLASLTGFLIMTNGKLVSNYIAKDELNQNG